MFPTIHSRQNVWHNPKARRNSGQVLFYAALATIAFWIGYCSADLYLRVKDKLFPPKVALPPQPATAPLSEIIEALNERFATNFSDEDRLFFEQIKERALKNSKVIQTGQANPFDKWGESEFTRLARRAGAR